LMTGNKAAVWISADKKLFAPALKIFGMDPEKVIFIKVSNVKDALWVLEEVLKCEGLAAAVAELRDIGFVESRRLQLAVEQSRVTGFILRPKTKQLQTSACIARWHIAGLPSVQEEGKPGLGFPRWRISLLKVRNGKTGIWEMEWRGGHFYTIPAPVSQIRALRRERKTG
ncbi:MAG: Error-prone repair protein ImuA, partial [Bacteroidetes bacterium]|nr:Error-prone repair protein ImuA [Bacteroidota bacterium]